MSGDLETWWWEMDVVEDLDDEMLAFAPFYCIVCAMLCDLILGCL